MEDSVTNHNTCDKSSPCINKKRLLTDPVKYFTRSHPDNRITIKTLSTLHQQRTSLLQQQNRLQTQTGILSRQIGAAKKNKLPADELLKAMQTLSADKKQLNKQISKISQAILENFKLNDTGNSIHPENTDNNIPRRHYPETVVDVEGIKIGRLEDNLETDNINNAAWNHYVDNNPDTCIHHRTEWAHILNQCYGHNSLYLYARNKHQQIVGILPLIHISSRLFGNQLVSMPFFQRAGAIADSPLIEEKLIHAATEYGRKLNVDHIEFRDTVTRNISTHPLPVETHKVNMIFSLPENEVLLWSGFKAKLRSQIRRAQRASTRVFIGHSELLDDFYRVYSHNMRDLGSPVQSKFFIKTVLTTFPQNSWLIVIHYNHHPVAAGFLLGSGNTLEIPLASTLHSVNPLSINMLLYWEVLKFAVANHFKQFDFGRSSKGGGTYRFKQQWGANPMQLYWHYWLGKADKPPSLKASNPKYALVINTWKHLPLALANRLGPLIVKNIP